MCRRFDQNRALLTKFIYGQTTPFTKDWLIREFHRIRKGDIIIDGCQTIAQFLEELTEYHALDFNFFTRSYSVRTPQHS